jgi:hypothetical protein
VPLHKRRLIIGEVLGVIFDENTLFRAKAVTHVVHYSNSEQIETIIFTEQFSTVVYQMLVDASTCFGKTDPFGRGSKHRKKRDVIFVQSLNCNIQNLFVISPNTKLATQLYS